MKRVRGRHISPNSHRNLSKGYTTRVVVVDGGSNDNTVKIAVDLGCEVIEQWGEGKGTGMRQGFKKFLEKKMETGNAGL